jgi:hypothetical protein
MNAYYRTGMHPFNPFCEERAIESLGLKNDNEREKLVMYEVVPKEDRQGKYADPILTEVEKKSLQEGLNILPANDLGDHSAAIIRAVKILKKWKMAIKHAVSEGEKYEEYSKAYSPLNEVKTDSENLAMKYVVFELVDISKVKLSLKLTKEEKECQHTEDIIASTKILEAIQLTCSKLAVCTSNSESEPTSRESTSLPCCLFRKCEGPIAYRRSSSEIEAWEFRARTKRLFAATTGTANTVFCIANKFVFVL